MMPSARRPLRPRARERQAIIGPPRGSVQYFGLFVVVVGALLLIGLAIVEGGQWPLVAALFVVVAATLLIIERARTR